MLVLEQFLVRPRAGSRRIAIEALIDVASYCGLSSAKYIQKLPVVKGRIWPKIKKLCAL
jgi:hypothetical protein